MTYAPIEGVCPVCHQDSTNAAFQAGAASRDAEIAELRQQVTLLRDALITIRDEPVETDEHDGIEPHVVASEALTAAKET
jgi:hypothetical protein